MDEINKGGKEIDALRPQLDGERDELQKSGEVLKAELAEVDRHLGAVREWEGKVRVYTTEIENFNKRNAGVLELPRNQQEKAVEELKAERARLEKLREALAVEEAKAVPTYQTSARIYNERAIARDAKAREWNARNKAAVDASVKQQEARALWLNECASKPYLEDDEKAIRAGK